MLVIDGPNLSLSVAELLLWLVVAMFPARSKIEFAAGFTVMVSVPLAIFVRAQSQSIVTAKATSQHHSEVTSNQGSVGVTTACMHITNTLKSKQSGLT